MFAALEFDHALFRPQIRWIVVSCAGLGHKCGGPVALSPRHDVAYFVNPETAKDDAEAFAELKNRQAEGRLDEIDGRLVTAAESGAIPQRHFAYSWDHQLMALEPLRWAVLEWSGDPLREGPRDDAAYFTDPATAEQDARLFALLRERRMAGSFARKEAEVSPALSA